MLYGLADLDEKSEPFPGGETALVVICCDLDPLDQFHDKVRPTSVGCTGIQHPGNVGMIHEGQRLALGFEAGDNTFGVHAQLDHFKSDPTPDRFLLLGHIDNSAAAFADLLEQLVTA